MQYRAEFPIEFPFFKEILSYTAHFLTSEISILVQCTIQLLLRIYTSIQEQEVNNKYIIITGAGDLEQQVQVQGMSLYQKY